MQAIHKTRRAALVGTLALSAALLAAGCGEDGGPTEPEDGTVVVFAFQGWPEDTMRVLVRKRETVEAARAYIEGTAAAHIPIGPIVRGAGIDPRYPYHFLPEQVNLAEVTIELCDGRPMRTPEAVDAFFEGATGNPDAEQAVWCPWGGYPIEVED